MKEEEKLWKKELDALLGKLVDDCLTVADKARLNEILQTEPEARELYHEYLDLHGALGERLGILDFSSLNTAQGTSVQIGPPDAPRGTISVTERATYIGRVRALARGSARQWLRSQGAEVD